MVAGDAHTQVGQTSERAPPVLLTHAAAADEGTLGAARASDVAAPVDAQLQLFPMLRTLYHDPLYRVEPERQETVCPHCPGLVPRGYPIDLEPLWLHALRCVVCIARMQQIYSCYGCVCPGEYCVWLASMSCQCNPRADSPKKSLKG